MAHHDAELAEVGESAAKSNELTSEKTLSSGSDSVEQKRNLRDAAVLAKFGKKQQLRRGFGLIQVIGLTSTLMITWESTTATLSNGLENGGPAGLVYGFIFVWIGSFFQTLVMAEMASMIPLAGGPFNWVAILSPPWCRKFLSYLAGWLTVISWQSFVAASAFITGTEIQALLILNYPDYVFQRWHSTLLFYAVILVSVFVNTYLGRILPQIESLMLFFHVLGFFGIFITILYLAPHQPAGEVFGTFLNLGGWRTDGLSFFVGLATAMAAFPGMDAADHIAEEIQDAPRVIPLSMNASTALNGTLGFAMLLAILFCMPSDITSILDNKTFYPMVGIFQWATGSVAGASALTAILVSTQVFSAVGMLATVSRMLWAFAREGGVPFSRYLCRVDERTMLPLYSIAATTIISMLLALINIGSSVGFGAFISLIIISYYSSFILAAGVMLNKRLTTPNDQIPWGPFRLGRFGVPVTIIAIMFSLLGGFFSLWPTAVDPTLTSMNYCILVFGSVLLFAGIFWLVHGRKTYTGPVIEIENL